MMAARPSWKERARHLKTETHALCLAYKDPRVPWYAKVFLAGIIAYALSPIDLIPDFIPVLGYLDDLVILPLGMTLALRMIPPDVLSECREAARSAHVKGRYKWVAGLLIVLLWLLALWVVAKTVWRLAF